MFSHIDSDDEELSDWTAEYSHASTPRDHFFLPTEEELKAVAATGSPMEGADSDGEFREKATQRAPLADRASSDRAAHAVCAIAAGKPRRKKVTFADLDVRFIHPRPVQHPPASGAPFKTALRLCPECRT